MMILENIDTLIYEMSKGFKSRISSSQTKRNIGHFWHSSLKDKGHIAIEGAKTGIKKALPGLISANATGFDFPGIYKAVKDTISDVKHKRFDNLKDPKIMLKRAAEFTPGNNTISTIKEVGFSGPLKSSKFDRISKRRRIINPINRNIRIGPQVVDTLNW